MHTHGCIPDSQTLELNECLFSFQNSFSCTDMESLKAPLDIPMPDPAKEEEKRKKKEEVAVQGRAHLRHPPLPHVHNEGPFHA